MCHTSSLLVPGGGSGGPSKEDGLKTGSGSGDLKDLELSDAKGIGTAVNSGFGSGGSSEFEILFQEVVLDPFFEWQKTS